MNIKMTYCSTCGGKCCPTECSDKYFDGIKCNHGHDGRKEVCDEWPFIQVGKYYNLHECRGLRENPEETKELHNELDKILDRLNKGEINFEVSNELLYFKI